MPYDDLECLQSLFLTNPSDDLAAIQRSKGKRVEGTCEWLLVQKEYTTWLVGDNPQLLRLVGGPGIGKTMISSFLVDELEKRAQKSPAMTFAYYFCDNKDVKRNTATAIIRGLLLQLLRQHHKLFGHIQPDYKQMKGQLFDNFDALWRILLNIIRDFKAGEIYLLVDALDECEKWSRQALLVRLAELFPSSGASGTANVKFLITCRPESEIQEALLEVKGQIRVDSGKVNMDLSRFINVKVDDLSKRKAYNPKMTQTIKDALMEKAGGTFLWASLVLDDLGKTKISSQVKQKLQTLPADLNKLYDRILSQIDADCVDIADFVLRCVVVARRPLTVGELAMTRALGMGEWEENTMPPEDLLEELKDGFKCCEPLVYVDDNNETVNLVHQSAKDYLLGEYLEANVDFLKYHVVRDSANLLMFQICWRYLNMDEFEHGTKIIERSPDNKLMRLRLSEEYLNAHVFLRYATEEWQEHVLATGQALITDFLLKSDDLGKVPTLRDSWLYQAAENGQETVVKLLLEKGADIAAKENDGRTVLHTAVSKDREAVVKLLLEKGADIAAGDNSGWMAIHYAAASGHEAMMRLLLDQGVDIEARSKIGYTALIVAAGGGHEAVVRLLIEKGADVGAKDSSGYSALHTVAEMSGDRIRWGVYGTFQATTVGYEAVVRLLLEKGAELEGKSEVVKTPLLYAAGAGRGNEAVVKLLLEKGAELDVKDQNGQTPLSYAAENGSEAVIALLLEKGAELDVKDQNGRTPLSYAAENGSDAVIALLLERGAELDVKDQNGRTPLSYAAKNGSEAVIALLLEKGAELDVKDQNGRTPLSHAAAAYSQEAVIALLLEKGAELDVKDQNGRTPLSHAAAAYSQEAVIALLLEKGAELDVKDQNGRTPLSYAAENGSDAVIALLLEKGAELDVKDQNGRTPLSHAAAAYSQEAVIALLLEKGAELDVKDQNGRTPLSYAAENGREAGVKLFLAKDGVNPNLKDENGRTPQSWAAEKGHDEVVDLLAPVTEPHSERSTTLLIS